MKVILIIAHHSILPEAYKGFERVLDSLRHELPGTRVTSTSLTDLEDDLRILLREDAESVTLLPYLLLNGQHTKNDVPRIVSRLQAEFPQIPMRLLPCLGDWNGFPDMVVDEIRSVYAEESPCVENYCSAESPLENVQSPSSAVSHMIPKSRLFSMEMNLEGRNVLVVGGGRIALRKVKSLLPTGACITVVAPVVDGEFRSVLSSAECSPFASLRILERAYDSLDLRGMSLVFICTDRPSVNAKVSNDARARRILVNNACDYLDGDFIVPARLDFGENVAVTVSTQGNSPSLAKAMKREIQDRMEEKLENMERNFFDANHVSKNGCDSASKRN